MLRWAKESSKDRLRAAVQADELLMAANDWVIEAQQRRAGINYTWTSVQLGLREPEGERAQHQASTRVGRTHKVILLSLCC